MLSRLTPVVLAFALVFAFAAGADATSHVDVTGDWSSNWDDVKLVREGNRVFGTYVCCGGGKIEGRVFENRIIRYHWESPNGGGGEGVWEIMSSQRLDGTWGSGQSDDDGGRWDLVRKSSLAN
ncbi:MAG TPA: hypothetical protein VIV11_42535 [Kofleriaceae bacterium]